MRDTDVDIG